MKDASFKITAFLDHISRKPRKMFQATPLTIAMHNARDLRSGNRPLESRMRAAPPNAERRSLTITLASGLR